MKYIVIDNYENDDEVIGTFDDLRDAVYCVHERVVDTDGECSAFIYQLKED